MAKDITFVTSSPIGRDLNTRQAENGFAGVFSRNRINVGFFIFWMDSSFLRRIRTNHECVGIIVCMRPANERRRYSVTPSLIGWAHTHNDLWMCNEVNVCGKRVALWPLLGLQYRYILIWSNPCHIWWSGTRRWNLCIQSSNAWCRHQMETFFALLALCEGNPPVTGGFPSQRPVTRDFDVFFDVRLNKRLSKQLRRWWYETPWRSLWRQCNGVVLIWLKEASSQGNDDGDYRKV